MAFAPQMRVEAKFNPNSRVQYLDSQLRDLTISVNCMIAIAFSAAGLLTVTSLLIGIVGEMKQLIGQENHHLESIDRNTIQKVVQTYAGRKANGLSEMAARNAAVLVLREDLPSWTFRAASEMVSRIIAFSGQAGSGPAGQTA